MDLEKGDFVQTLPFAWNSRSKKRRGFNLETHFAFVDYEKDFENVKRKKKLLYEEKNIPNLLLKTYIRNLYT
jgi:hypothetical protein